MLEKLESLLKRYKEIQGLLAENDVVTDIDRCHKLAKELSSMQDLVNMYKRYKKVAADIDSTKTLIQKETHGELMEMAKKEIEELESEKARLLSGLEEAILEEDPDVDKDVIMEIRAGTGGAEASLFAGDLFRMYSKYAASQGWKIEILDSHVAEVGGFKEIIFSVKGKNVYRMLKHESGTHRVQRVPATESSGRIHTSAVTVAVLPEAEDVDVEIDPQDLRIDTYRSSGAGGQHVNVTDSAVRITYIPTGVVVQCQNERSQYKNKMAAMKVLRARILENLRTEQRKKTADDRKSQVGTGDRSEKIRTYNYPDRRVTDHRIGFTIHKLDRVIEGEIGEIIGALLQAEKKLKLGQAKR
ncbi:MAG: peptide chain release factor 1 [Candidatus Omnitrophica bacterium]|nr:peptide chain release factor 1 [Candidatus Omnitrophota bacterium]MBU1932805.1 peptide chain release factor 1 [Candidatus Omnitrophota bacterium]